MQEEATVSLFGQGRNNDGPQAVPLPISGKVLVGFPCRIA
jgi:hypothetical protein